MMLELMSFFVWYKTSVEKIMEGIKKVLKHFYKKGGGRDNTLSLNKVFNNNNIFQY